VLLHAIYWLAVSAAERRPLALIVHDLHWPGRASLRFLEFLGRRPDGVPISSRARTARTTRALTPSCSARRPRRPFARRRLRAGPFPRRRRPA
jgi:predicted ATPase